MRLHQQVLTFGLVLFFTSIAGCTVKDSEDNDGTGGSAQDAGEDGAVDGSAGSTQDADPDGSGPGKELPGSHCPSSAGFTIEGKVRLAASFQGTPKVVGPDVVVKVPCGRETTDPDKKTCGTGDGYVFLCTTPDCTADSDPVRSLLVEDVSLEQASHDSFSFKLCGIEEGDYYVLPFIDHDESQSVTNYDWTMGIKNIAATDVKWPARVHGYEVKIDKNVELGTNLVTNKPDTSPVVIDYFEYKHPTPEWTAEEQWLYVASSLHPDVVKKGIGMRALDLKQRKEIDQDESTPQMDGAALETPDGNRYKGDLTKLAVHDGVAYMATDIAKGVILTVKLGKDGKIVQGKSIDLRALELGLDKMVMRRAAVLEVGTKKFLAISTTQLAAAPLPHKPETPLLIVDLDGIETADVKDAVKVTSKEVADLKEVRLDDLFAYKGVLYAAETGNNSFARKSDLLNRLWAFEIGNDGTVKSHKVYEGTNFAPDAGEECSAKQMYDRAGLWVGNINGATHAVLGGLRHVAIWKFAQDKPDAGQRVRNGSGSGATDLRLDDYSLGYSLMRSSPDGKKLYVFGECKSRWLAVRPADWAGKDGMRTQSRRRIAVLDLEQVDSDGVPKVDKTVGDKQTAPDIVRESVSSPDKTLNDDLVGGIGLDCRGVLWDLFDVFGYTNIAGSTFGSSCVASVAADAVVTDKHIYVIGRGNLETDQTGLGPASEVWLLDLETGREVLDPSWRWFYDGSAYQHRYGYFGLTLGERDTTDVAKGLFLVPMK